MSTDLPALLSAGPLVLDAAHRVLDCEGVRHHLTPKECRLLETFITYQDQVLTRQFLMREIWETDYSDDTRTLEVHVHWLRQKIESGRGRPALLQTVRGVGYVFRPSAGDDRFASVAGERVEEEALEAPDAEAAAAKAMDLPPARVPVATTPSPPPPRAAR